MKKAVLTLVALALVATACSAKDRTSVSDGGAAGAGGSAGAAGATSNYPVPCFSPGKWEKTCPAVSPKCIFNVTTQSVYCAQCHTSSDCTAPKQCTAEFVCQ